MKHISGQSKAKIQETTLSMVTFFSEKDIHKKRPQTHTATGFTAQIRKSPKTKKVTIW